MLFDYLKNNILITDGGMGTYYYELTGNDNDIIELANLTNPQIIEKIHSDYIKAGAKLVRTNTFSANTQTLEITKQKLKQIIDSAYSIAKKASQNNAFIAANMGPIPENYNPTEFLDILDEYYFIIDCFIENGATIFNFETFSDTNHLKEISSYIKQKNPDIFIITSFTFNIDGETRKGITIENIFNTICNINTIDVFGLNCGIGPTHLYNILKKLDTSKKIISALPNAGYPEVINERTIYRHNESYFAEKIIEIRNIGVKIIGGCCGTNPEHIKKITKKLDTEEKKFQTIIKATEEIILKQETKIVENKFYQKLKLNQFAIAVELDPPTKADFLSIEKGAKQLANNSNVDIVTVADSPSGRVRLNSMIIASKIKRECGIDTMPHICCRDRNIISLKSDIMAGYLENIRNILAITGDPIPKEEKNEIKSVFNCNSFTLMSLITELNKNEFINDPVLIGGALSVTFKNPDVVMNRIKKKID
ncbi:MAG: bifunctional homocysteine S-methyltransferase/methylenetetrahydrofolate reductase, partial [Spirochaetes bacterium GWB1_27_13]